MSLSVISMHVRVSIYWSVYLLAATRFTVHAEAVSEQQAKEASARAVFHKVAQNLNRPLLELFSSAQFPPSSILFSVFLIFLSCFFFLLDL